jgi:hypothetical protein
VRWRPRTEKTSFFQSQWKKIVTNNNNIIINNNGDEEEQATLRGAEEEEEEGEGRGDQRGSRGIGAVEAWADGVVDRIGVASERYFCIACLVEIEWDRSKFLWTGE